MNDMLRISSQNNYSQSKQYSFRWFRVGRYWNLSESCRFHQQRRLFI